MSAPLSKSFATPADMATCRALLRGGSRSFFTASFLLPARISEAATALYSFCRVADDAIDLSDDYDNALADLQQRLDQAYAGCPAAIAADRAFADVVARFAVPKALPAALLEGFEWDASGRRYQTLSELYGYAARVAGTVGAMMSILMGARDPQVIARACDLGVAMQLTNIARDVGEDARAGRIYLPLEWLTEVGIDVDVWLTKPRYSAALGTLVQRLLDVADVLYRRSEIGIWQLPSDCRSGIYAARFIYAEIGREIERIGLDSVSQRAVVSKRRKLQLLMQAYRYGLLSRNHKDVHSEPVLAEVQFLLDAVDENDHRYPLNRRSLDQQLAWLIDLFTRLEHCEQSLPRTSTKPLLPTIQSEMR